MRPCCWIPSKQKSGVSKPWRQIWRVAGRESGFPETSRKFPKLPRKFFGDFPGSSLTVELNSNPEVPRKFPKLPRKFPKLPRKLPDFPGGQSLSLGSLTPSLDLQNLSLKTYGLCAGRLSRKRRKSRNSRKRRRQRGQLKTRS